jgi:hypothetical protein
MREKLAFTPLTLQRDPIEPNEDVAAAIVALGSELPDDVSVDLCLLAPDTVRVSHTGYGRTIDVTRELGSEYCDVLTSHLHARIVGTRRCPRSGRHASS